MRVQLALAKSRREVLACQYLIAEIYNKDYEVVFSDDSYDLDAKIEPWPHRYLMGSVDGEVVVTAGLYLHSTYVERFGAVSDELIARRIAEAGAAGRFSPARKREITKISVRRDQRRRGLGRFILASAHARDFLQVDADPDEPHVLVSCAKRSIWDGLWHRAGIRTRPLAPFPDYKVHELYRSPDDPMDSRLVVPEVDVPERWYERRIPGEYEVEE